VEWGSPAWRQRPRRRYGYETQIVYMLAKDGKIIADDDAKVSFETDRVAIDRKIGKPVADVTRYTFRDADTAMITHAPSNQNGIGRVPQHLLESR
jgi:hypothetical protein